MTDILAHRRRHSSNSGALELRDRRDSARRAVRWSRFGHLLRRNTPFTDRQLSSVIEVRQTQGLSIGDPRDDLATWWQAMLGGHRPTPACEPERQTALRVVDLFSGAGGFAVGLSALTDEAGLGLSIEVAVDIDAEALAVYAANHPTRKCIPRSVETLVDARIRGSGKDAAFVYEPELIREAVDLEGCDLVIAGPPCQGHSNLNNRTRRTDRRNLYYLRVPAFAVAASARVVIIENVPAVLRDQDQVVEGTKTLLQNAGYHVIDGTLSADEMGWPQTRTRHFLIARRGDAPPIALAEIAEAHRCEEPLDVMWAIGHGQPLATDPALHRETQQTKTIADRINQLFADDDYVLGNAHRPPSHQNGHSYSASYGRMYPDRPAPTITTGFTTPGRGRFVHPTERRTITPAEAARLQGFPDTYRWRPTPDSPPPTRTNLAKWIGDAVPLPLGYAAALAALGPDLPAAQVTN